MLDSKGPEAMATWVRQKKGVMVTDTTMRDAHQASGGHFHVLHQMFVLATFFARAHVRARTHRR